MKFLKITTLVAMAAVVLTGCLNEDMKITGGDEADGGKGYLSLSALDVQCRVHHKPVDEGKAEEDLATRSRATVDVNDFDCYILKESGEQVLAFKYGQRPSGNIELEKGKYILKMISGTVEGAAWEAPVYGHEEPFVITSKKVTTLEPIVCTMLNIQVSVSYTADLRAALSDDTTATVTIDPNSIVFGIDETRSAYFAATKPSNDLNIVIKGMYTPEGKDVASAFEMTSTIENVKAGEYSDITLLIEYSQEGNIAINTTIYKWVEDDEIVCDFSSVVLESFLEDESTKPTIVWAGNDIDAPLNLTPDKFDGSGNYMDDVIIEIDTQSTIASLLVNVNSTNEELNKSFTESGLASIDMCNVTSFQATMLKAMDYPVNDEVLGHKAVSFNLKSQIKVLYDYEGTHSFKITAIDEKGNSTEKTLVMVVGGTGGPVIVWTGYNINDRYEIVDGMTADFVVTSEVGIKKFTVHIISDVLDPATLRGIELCDVLDLTYPANSYDSTDPSFVGTPDIGDKLAGLGFPYGDQVINKNEVKFSITGFLSLLKATGSGDTNFKMTVTDNDGAVTERTVMMYVK